MGQSAAPEQHVMPTTKQRVSINLPESEYAELAALAEKHGVSMAWIGRKAICSFLELCRADEHQLPLFFEQSLKPRSGGRITS